MSLFSIFSRLVVGVIMLCITIMPVSAGFFDDFIDGGSPDIRYCDDDGECGLQEGIDIIKGNLDNIETDRKASDYIQDIVIYVLGLVTIVGVIYIIYAGFMILIGNGDEEKLKKSRQTIIFVLVGITLIWLAYPILLLLTNILNA